MNLRRSSALGALLLLLAGCEVSFFGNDPIIVASTSGRHTTGSSASPCGEPDDAHAARTANACGERCTIDFATGETDCDAARLDAESGLVTLDLGAADGLAMTLEICDPEGQVLHLSDSLSSELSGGDGGRSDHHSSVALEGTTLTVRPSEGSERTSEASSVTNFVAATGCTTRTLSLSDQLVFLADLDRGMCGPGVLRISPPVDSRGAPDALWHLAVGRSLTGDRRGSGLRSASLCFW